MWPFEKKYGGMIAGHSLQKWWQSLGERDRVLVREVTATAYGATFDSGPARKTKDVRRMLVDLASMMQRDDRRATGRAIMMHAEQLPHESADVLDKHFTLSATVQFYYRCRNDDSFYLQKCEEACRRMIAIAPLAAAALRTEFPKSPLPCHLGYGRLCWLLEKAGDPEGSRLRQEAEKEGWIVSI
jgi:hypothetical protein